MFKSRRERMHSYTQIVVLALIKQNNTFLFSLRHDPGSDYHNKWQIPGGGLEFAETPEQTLHREVREELGVEVKNIKLVPFIDTKVRGNWQGIFISYVCELKDHTQQITLNEEASEYKWLTIQEIQNINTLPGCIELLTAAKDLPG